MTRPLKAVLSVAGVLGLGLAAAIGLAVMRRAESERTVLFPQPPDVPSVSAFSPAPEWEAAVESARTEVRAAILEQNLPGISIAVGAGSKLVWAEGFGYRDVATETRVTPETRFNIGTASTAVMDAWGKKEPGAKDPEMTVVLNNTGADEAADWSPEHIGEPEEDPPPFRIIREAIFEPLHLADPPQPLPGERATFYVPKGGSTDPRKGRLKMPMRELACCAVDGKAFYSTPTDLVRFALATKAESVHGMLAGGNVVSVVSRRVKGGVVVVAVASNVAHANTAALAEQVAEAFAGK